MSSVFDSYERQFFDASSKISRKCSSFFSIGEDKKQKLAELQNGLEEAESLIKKMDLEARSLQPTQKATLLAKLREYKTDLSNLKRDVKRLSVSNDPLSSRDELLEAGLSDSLMASTNQRERLVMSTERLHNSSDRLKESRRTILEAEELGVSVLQDLHQQRQTLLHSRDTLNDVDDNIGRSKRILISMSRRMNRNKWIMGSLIVALIVAILLIAYAKLSH